MAKLNLFARLSGRVLRIARRWRRNYRKSAEKFGAQRRLRREIEVSLARRTNDACAPLPDFLIIGAPKCATSWLQASLSLHPQVRIVPDEIEYFSSHIDRPLKWYLAHFENLIEMENAHACLTGDKRVLGEKSAGYCGISPARIKLVHRLLPEARLILMVRDPVSRHWSHAKRYFSKLKSKKKGYESLDSREQLYEFFVRTRRFSEFSKTIKNWTTIYPPDRLLVISQEAAFADPICEFEKVLSHLGVSGVTDAMLASVRRKNKNSGPVVPMPDDVKKYLERMFAQERKSLANILNNAWRAHPKGPVGAL
jgi:Sulfotransferase family